MSRRHGKQAHLAGVRGVDLLDRLQIPAGLYEPGGRLVHLNAAGRQVTGYSVAQLRGRGIEDLLPTEARDQVMGAFTSAAEGGESADVETAFIDAGGRRRAARMLFLPLQQRSDLVGVLVLAFEVRTQALAPPRLEPPPRLTPRQSEVLSLVSGGLTTVEIAQRLTLSSETVKNHLRAIYSLLRVHSRLEAVLAAERLGLLPPRPLGLTEAEEPLLH